MQNQASFQSSYSQPSRGPRCFSQVWRTVRRWCAYLLVAGMFGGVAQLLLWGVGAQCLAAAAEVKPDTRRVLAVDETAPAYRSLFDYRVRRGFDWRNGFYATPALFNTITVTGTADGTLGALAGNGTCDLREAIQAANTNAAVGECPAGAAGLDTINFNLPGPGYTINVAAGGLQTITQPVVIEGAPFAGSPDRVELNGTLANADGLRITAGGSTIRKLVINRFSGDGIELNGSSGNFVEGCYLGTDAGGTLDQGNAQFGVNLVASANNLIGGTTTTARNVISGNNFGGVQIDFSGNTVQGNYIGTDKDGEAVLGNSGHGVNIIFSGATNNSILGNVISGNASNGLSAGNGASGTVVRGNLIGTDKDGDTDLGNAADGIGLGSGTNNIIGGTSLADRNVIAGNNGTGLALGVQGVTVQGNYIGTNSAGTAALGNSLHGIVVGGNTTIGGTTGTTPGGNCTGACNLISGNGQNGIVSNGNTIVLGNYLGTDVTGNVDLGNTLSGVVLSNGFSGLTVGGTTPETRNLISGNNQYGIQLVGGGATVQGNYIGMNVAGATDLGNSKAGIQMINFSAGNLIGGTTAGAGNLISGNDEDGVVQATNGFGSATPITFVQGNLIGTDVTGTLARGNTRNGIGAIGSFIVIGGIEPSARNIISGNGGDGIGDPPPGVVPGHGALAINRNYIGTDINGMARLGNGGNGIRLTGGHGAVIGGTMVGEGNLISANGGNGLNLEGGTINGPTVQGNLIGTDKNGLPGAPSLGNTANGIRVVQSNVTIGGASAAERNVIAYNTQNGVELTNSVGGTNIKGNEIKQNTQNGVQTTQTNGVNTIGSETPGEGNLITGNLENGVQVRSSASGVKIRGNAISGNTKLGIDLAPTLPGGTVTPNDPTDNDGGPNLLQNFPVLDVPTQPCTVTGTLPGGVLNSQVTLDFYANAVCGTATLNNESYGEGEVYLGSLPITLTSSNTMFSFPINPGLLNGKYVITATATDANGNTSEFSACRTIPTPTANAGLDQALCSTGAATTFTLAGSAANGAAAWSVFSGPVSITNQGALNSPAVFTGTGTATLRLTVTGACVTATDDVVLTVNPTPATPTITAGGPTTFCQGGSVTLNSSSATGNQWYLNSNPIGGATNQSFSATAAGSYTVIVTASGCPSAPSTATTVTVNPTPVTPTISAGGPTTFCDGGSVTLNSSSATGNQWYLNGNPISGATNQAYSATAAGSYTVVVTVSGCPSAPSTATTVTVNPTPATPTISADGPTTFCDGGSVTLNSSSATGNQWYLNGNPISGATNQSFSATAAGSYTVIVTANGCPSAASAATTVTVNTAPSVIMPHPQNQSVTAGANATFTAAADGTPAPTVQWEVNTADSWMAIAGATSTTLMLNSVALAMSGNRYRAVFANECNAEVRTNEATLTVTPAGPQTIIVNTLVDEDNTGPLCSLREAIIAANINTAYGGCTTGTAGADVIEFALGGGMPVIGINGYLPAVFEPVTINGATDGASFIVLDGTNSSPFENALSIAAANCVIRNLVIKRFDGAGINLSGPGGSTVENCRIGTDALGQQDEGNRFAGIYITSPNNTIRGNLISGNNTSGIGIGLGAGNLIVGNCIGTNLDGTTAIPNGTVSNNLGRGIDMGFGGGATIGGTNAADRNVISGNRGPGIYLDGVSGSANVSATILGNIIGRTKDGMNPLGNNGHGIELFGASNIIIGGSAPGSGNVISANTGAGVAIYVNTAAGNKLSGNAIFGNGQLGIDLANDGITPNDPLDADAGPNNLQNYPRLNSQTMPGTVTGTLDSLPANTAYPVRLDFYANAGCDVSGNGEGEVYLSAISLTGPVTAPSFFTFTYTPVAGKAVITATATDNNGNTSEFSPCACATITLTPPTLPNGTVNTAYNQQLTASGGAGGPYQFGFVSGLPSGMFNTTTGQLIGTPTAAGTFNLSVPVFEISCITSQPYTLTINVPSCPTITVNPNTPLAFGVVGTVYPTTTISASGGPAPYSFNASGLPPGLSLTGTATTFRSLSGTPTTAGVYNLIVTVTDSNNCPGSRTFLIVVHSATPTLLVTTADDEFNVNPAACSLREAIIAANTNAAFGGCGAGVSGYDTIGFDARYSIALTGGLPGPSEPVFINGLVGAARVELNGGGAAGAQVVLLQSANNYLKSLVINRLAGGNAINISGANAFRNAIEDCYLGTNTAGTAALPNGGGIGVFNAGPFNRSSSSAGVPGNVISGNSGPGVNIVDSPGTQVSANLIGVQAGGSSAPLGNGGNGVSIRNTIAPGSTTFVTLVSGNLIAYNAVGVSVTDSVTGQLSRISNNNIFNNTQLGIDLGGDGVTANDAGDADTGPNRLQNFPVLTGITPTATGGTVSATLDTAATNALFPVSVQFFASSACDPSGFGEGESFLGQVTGITAAAAASGFSFNYTFAQVVGKPFITAVAIDGFGNTSEFSACRQAFTCPAVTLQPATLPAALVGNAYTAQLFLSGAGITSSNNLVISGTLPPGVTLNVPATQLEGTPTTAGSYTFTATWTFNNTCQVSRTYTLTVTCPNVSIGPATLPAALVGNAYTAPLFLSGSGVTASNNLVITGDLPPGITLYLPATRLEGTPTTAGSYTFTATWTFNGTCLVTRQYTLTVTCPNVTIGPATLPNGVLNTPYQAGLFLSGTGVTASNNLVITGTLPPGITLYLPATRLEGTPTATGAYSFTATWTFNGSCTVARAYTLTVTNTGGGPNVSPVLPPGSPAMTFANVITPGDTTITPIPPPNAGPLPPGFVLPGLNVAFEISTTAVFSGPVLLTFDVPAGVKRSVFKTLRVLHQENGVLVDRTILPPDSPAPLFVPDPAPKKISARVTSFSPFVVGGLQTAPNVALSANPAAPTYGQNVAITATITNDSDPVSGGTVTFKEGATTLAGPLPLDANGQASFNTSSLTVGAHMFTAQYGGDGVFLPANGSGNVNVGCPAITLTPATLPNGVTGSAYSPQTLSAIPLGTAYSFAVTQGQLPPGLTLNGTTGVLNGTPTAAGNYSFSVTATGFGACTGVRGYSLFITGTCAPVTVSPATLPGGTLGAAYAQPLSAAGGTAPYSFNISNGALPAGLTLDANTGVLGGAPTQAGSFTFTVRAAGVGGCSGSRPYVLSIACSALNWSPDTLPGAKAGQPYSQQLSVSPASNATFSLLLGSLPPGFTLSNAGLLSGVSNTTGTFNFTAKATAGSCQSTKSYVLTLSNTLAVRGDFDGDGKSDPYSWSEKDGRWRIVRSSDDKLQDFVFGAAGDVSVPGDYDGDGRWDAAVFRPSNGTWYVRLSSNGRDLVKAWGGAADTPVPADYDGDGKTDLAVWRGAEGGWYVLPSSDGVYQNEAWGAAKAPYNDVPVPGDYDGDGKSDLAVFRRGDGNWYIKQSRTGQVLVRAWGLATDVPVPADYDGDGKTDIAVWRGQEGHWYVLCSADNSIIGKAWGTQLPPYFDAAAPGDYDGDGKADVAVCRQGSAWYIVKSSDGVVLTRQLP